MPNAKRRRWRTALLIATPVGLVLLALLWPARSLPEPSAAPAPSWSEPRSWQPQGPRAPKVVKWSKSPTRFISDIRVDRADVCPNEPVFVEVDARDGRQPPQPLRILIGLEGGKRAAVRFPQPGEQRLLVRAIATDSVEDSRVLSFTVHDCGDAFQFVAIKAEPTAQQDTYRFVATPFFDRPQCVEIKAPDGGPASHPDLQRCHAKPEEGESLTFRWDFGDGATTTTGAPFAEHDFADRRQDDIQSNFVVKVDVESSLHGTITGFTNVLFANMSTANKLRVGVITPSIVLGARAPSDPGTLAWEATARNPEPTTLRLDDVEVTLTACSGDDTRTFRVPARQVLDDTELAPGATKTRAHLPTADVGPDYCFASFSATGTAPGGFKVDALFGTRLRDDVGAIEYGADTADPELKKRFDRTMRALEILGRGQDGGTATVTDDEIRALQLQGKLD